MKLLLEVKDVNVFRKITPMEEDEASFEVIRCINLLHYFGRDEYGEILGKLCFLCGETLILEMKVDNSEKHGKLRCQNNMTIPTAGRIKQQVNHFGFSIEERFKLKDGAMKFVAERMPRIAWDGKKRLREYDEDTVVIVPLTHPQFEKCWDWERTKERIEREQYMIKAFKLWYFAPLSYCRLCERIHDGTHRLIAAKALGIQAVNIRILRDYTCRHTKEFRAGRSPKL